MTDFGMAIQIMADLKKREDHKEAVRLGTIKGAETRRRRKEREQRQTKEDVGLS